MSVRSSFTFMACIALSSAMLGALSTSGACAQGLARVDDTPAPASPFTAVVSSARDLVVSIRAERSVTGGGLDLDPMDELYRRYFPDDRGEGAPFNPTGSGTGFVVSRDGHILTNLHVIDRADAVSVRFRGESHTYEAVVVGSDPGSDLAVLKIERSAPLTPLSFGDSDIVRVGDWAIAVGNPFGNLEGSVTVGVVSAKGRSDLVIHGGAPRYQDFLQTDAAINFGNSGGPLLDLGGRVIGVNTAINKSAQGIGFAIPSNYARRVLEQIVAHGRMIRGYLGARTSDHLQDGKRQGALVEAVLPGSPAQTAGLLANDVIIGFAGEDVADDHDLQFLVSDAEIGQVTSCLVLRDGRRIELEVVPAEEPEAGSENTAREDTWHGMSVAPLGGGDPRVRRLKDALGVEGERGMMVIAVAPDGPAADAGLQPGDVILEINGRSVAGAEDFQRLREELAGSSETLSLLIESGGMDGYRLLEPDPGAREG
ncbi:trypsin-like peptidase domain-containing protein [bacterium]|nr:trypsin-like peptidase domain-containing protein [bacterium]